MDEEFVKEIVKQLRILASTTIDASSIIFGVLLPGRVSDRVTAAYEKYFFGGKRRRGSPR